jgi:hypothetical protein
VSERCLWSQCLVLAFACFVLCIIRPWVPVAHFLPPAALLYHQSWTTLLWRDPAMGHKALSSSNGLHEIKMLRRTHALPLFCVGQSYSPGISSSEGGTRLYSIDSCGLPDSKRFQKEGRDCLKTIAVYWLWHQANPHRSSMSQMKQAQAMKRQTHSGCLHFAAQSLSPSP